MTYKPPHRTYGLLLLLSVLLTAAVFLIQDKLWQTIVASIGAGGIASVCVAWLLDIRNTKIRTIEDKKKIDIIMNQFIRLFRRLLWETANECYGYYDKDECHSFKDWLAILSSIEPHCPKEGQRSMKQRCLHVSGSITALQRQVEIYQSQSATLIFEEFPAIEESLHVLEILWIHCWGTLKQLESENYKAFCDTTFILYNDFIESFPQYRDRFPAEYSIHSLKP